MTARKDWELRWQEASSGALDFIRGAGDPGSLEALRLRLLGRKGRIAELLRELKDLPVEDRRILGGPANTLRRSIEEALSVRREELGKSARERELERSTLDPTLPGERPARGHLHPLTQVLGEMTSLLGRLGFSWAEGPLIEDERHNFEALNIPRDHPARDMQDTFYLRCPSGSPDGAALLRTHTSPVQIRRMESRRPPLRVMAPGRVFRHEATDASHSAVFHQVEGLHVDRQVSMADLKWTLETFLQGLFGSDTRTRLRPSYFPFTEPSAEADVQCLFCGGDGCAVCKRSGWIEILGAGLVHPNVLRAVDYDAEIWSGFAFGIGVERVAMLRLGIDDIRTFYQNDLRFLEQF